MDADEAGVEFALLNPLLRALEMLMFISRHLHPPDFGSIMASIGAPDDDLRSVRAKGLELPEHRSDIKAAIDEASDAVL